MTSPHDYEVVLHIGAPKTGTSAIQAYLSAHREQLAEAGYRYPPHPVDENNIGGGHVQIGGRLLSGRMDEARRTLDEWLNSTKDSGHTLLLSAESLYRLPTETHTLLGDLPVLVIAYVRDPIESLISNYNQAVKRGGATMSLPTFVDRRLREPNRTLSGEMLLDWRSTFGPEHTRILPYHRASFPHGMIELAMLQTLGIDDPAGRGFDTSGSNVNSGYSRGALELKRMLNTVVPTNHEANLTIDVAFQRYSDELGEPPIAPGELLDVEQYNVLRQLFSESNAALRDRLVDCPDGFLSYDADNKPDVLGPVGFDELRAIFDSALADDPQTRSEIHTLTTTAIDTGFVTNSAVFTLAAIIGAAHDDVEMARPGFTDRQREKLLTGKPSAVDFLRETAVMLEQKGEPTEALLFIDRAIEVRPDSTRLQRIRQRIYDGS
jgi:hypothetical protein